MVLKLFSLLLLVFCFSCNSSTETSLVTESEHEVVDAKTLYMIHCESCHGMDGKKGISGAADLSVSTLKSTEIIHVIKNGNEKGMMPYKDLIQHEEEISSLAEYVKNLRK